MSRIKSVRKMIRSDDGRWIDKINSKGKKVQVWSTFIWIIIDQNGKQHRRKF